MSARIPLALALALALPAATPAQVTCTLTPGSSVQVEWTNPAVWTPQVVPNNGTPPGVTYNAIIASEATVRCYSPITVQNLTYSSGALGLLDVGNGATLTVNESMTWGGTRLFSQLTLFSTGGTIAVNSGLNFGGGTIFARDGLQNFLRLAGGVSVWSGGVIRADRGVRIHNEAGSILSITGEGAIVPNSGNSGPIVYNDGVMRKAGGTGTTFVGANTFIENTGSIEVLSGSLVGGPQGIVGSGQFITNTGTITVGPGADLTTWRLTTQNGGRLRGNGTIGATGSYGSYSFAGNATLEPGVDGQGVLTVAGGSVDLLFGAKFAVDLNGTAVGSGYDQLNLGTTGRISLFGAILAPTLGYAPAPTDALAILFGVGSGQVGGVFDNAPAGQYFTVGTFQGITYEARAVYTDHSLTLTDFRIAGVPEPGGLALGALAAATLWRYRRRAVAKPRRSAACGPG